eukprot:m.381072 g.381072  ORF g.381072 m.381072 type:complete len:312 (+) comp28244_c0_seq1:2831-3766(+)
MIDDEPADAPPGGAGGDLAPAAAGDRHDSGGTAKSASGSECPATPAPAEGVAKISPPPRIPGTSSGIGEKFSSQEPERTMYVSTIVPFEPDNHSAMRTLGAVLYKMINTSRATFDSPFDLRKTTFLTYSLESDYLVWKPRPRGLEDGKWTTHRRLHPCKTLYIVHKLGGGQNCRVRLASSESGYLHVLKFWTENLKSESDGMRLQRKAWATIYPEYDAFVGVETWAGMMCLRMPYFRSVEVKDRECALPLVKEALTQIDKLGYVHSDVKWRNLGQSPDGEKIVLYDLDIHKKTDSDVNWIDTACNSLQTSM